MPVYAYYTTIKGHKYWEEQFPRDMTKEQREIKVATMTDRDWAEEQLCIVLGEDDETIKRIRYIFTPETWDQPADDQEYMKLIRQETRGLLKEMMKKGFVKRRRVA